MKQLLVLSLSVLLVAACKKDDKDAVKNTSFNIKNKQGTTVKIDIYPHEDNYKDGTNALFSLNVEGGASVTIPAGYSQKAINIM